MIKMTIDDEEVVSKNNFTIKEEMLSASSTILNNTYPKTWEQDHDYISRFYYPKDYAKLNIKKFSLEQEAEAGTTVEVNGSATLTDVDATKESRVLSLKGQTSQDGTPTPSSPIPVNVVSGDNEINICGKNFYNHSTNTSDYLSTYINQITSTSIILNGGGGLSSRFIRLQNFLTGFTYTISYKINNSYHRTLVRIRKLDDSGWLTNNDITWSGWDYNSTYGAWFKGGSNSTDVVVETFTPPSGLYFQVGIVNSATTEKAITEIQLEKNSTATTYEPYIGKSYPIYLGVENLSPISSMSTTNGGYINASTGHFGDVIAGKTYTVQFKNNSSYTNQIDVRVFHDNTYTSQLNKNLVANGVVEFTFTASNTGYIALNGKVASDTTDIFTEIKTTEGSHLQYISNSPIELCKIGTYQDYIYKEDGSWYLHKEIGKVVLDGSENWQIRTDVHQTGYTCFMNGSYIVNSRYTDSNITNLYCNYFVILAQYTSQPMIRIINANGYGETIMFPSSIASVQSNFKTWLSNHNTILYYVLPTPTNTEITDTTLISQLDNLESE